jgi:hypothetical protein
LNNCCFLEYILSFQKDLCISDLELYDLPNAFCESFDDFKYLLNFKDKNGDGFTIDYLRQKLKINYFESLFSSEEIDLLKLLINFKDLHSKTFNIYDIIELVNMHFESSHICFVFIKNLKILFEFEDSEGNCLIKKKNTWHRLKFFKSHQLYKIFERMNLEIVND